MIEFANTIIDILKDRFDGTITIETINKTNGEILTGLCFRKNENNNAPIVYIDDFYDEEYINDEHTMEMIANDIYQIMLNANEVNLEYDEITSWDYIKDNIFPVVLNASSNEDFTKDLVRKNILDLVLIYSVVAQNGTYKLTEARFNSIKEQYGIELETLNEIAWRNARRDVSLVNLSDFVRKNFGAFFAVIENPLWLLSNKSGSFGAAYMLDVSTLEDIAEKFGRKQFYILPSSIHECMIVNSDEFTLDELRNQVKTTNASALSPYEKLSDEVYLYDGNKVSIA